MPSTAPAATAPAAAGSAPQRTFASHTWGIRVDVPPGWTIRRGFASSYLANGAWKTFAAPDSQGEPVVALVVPGSNRITDAEIRIGASRAPGEVSRCTTPPATVRAGSIATARINGVTFTTFEAADAAMSHHLDVHAYRVVHDGTCYAIDLLVFGVNPEVYDPPAKPPFSNARAFRGMHAAVQSLRFFAPRQEAASASTAAR